VRAKVGGEVEQIYRGQSEKKRLKKGSQSVLGIKSIPPRKT